MILLLGSPVSAERIEQELTTLRADGSEITIHISRRAAPEPVSILLAVDGSLCIPSRLSGFIGYLSEHLAVDSGYALVTVEKPAPTVPEPADDGGYRIDRDFRCSDTFKRYYSVDRRVLDHLRAVQHLRRHATWWNGELVLWGFSSGGRIAGRVAAFTPETRRVAVAGFGGGTTMAEDFEHVHMCGRGKVEDRDGCIRELREQFEAMRGNPTDRKTWLGDANTWRAWASRIDAVEANILRDLTIPLLVVHGTEDRSNPISSARALAAALSGSEGPPYEFREVDGMGHGIGSGLSEPAAQKLRAELLAWLLDGPTPKSPNGASPKRRDLTRRPGG